MYLGRVEVGFTSACEMNGRQVSCTHSDNSPQWIEDVWAPTNSMWVYTCVCVCRNKRNKLLLTERKRWHVEGTYMHRHTITNMVLRPHLSDWSGCSAGDRQSGDVCYSSETTVGWRHGWISSTSQQQSRCLPLRTILSSTAERTGNISSRTIIGWAVEAGRLLTLM